MLRNLIILFILVFTSSVSFASWTQWLETDCNQIKKNADINHSYYKAEKCWKSTSSSAQAWFFDFDDGEVYLWLDVQRIIDGRTIWGNDYAYQNTKIDNIKRIINDYNLGTYQYIDSDHSNVRSTNDRIKFNYRNFETSVGKGFYGGQSKGPTFFTFGFFTSNMNHNLDKAFVSEILSSLNISALNKGVKSSVLPSSSSSNTNSTNINNNTDNQNTAISDNNNSSLSGDSFLKMCKSSKLSDLDKDVAMLCLEKMDK